MDVSKYIKLSNEKIQKRNELTLKRIDVEIDILKIDMFIHKLEIRRRKMIISNLNCLTNYSDADLDLIRDKIGYCKIVSSKIKEKLKYI